MAYDGKGDYNLPTPEYPAISGQLILAVDYNTILSDLASALSGVLVRDGQAPMTGPLAMGGQKITGLANGTNPQDAVTVLQTFTSPDFTDATMLGTTFTVTATTTAIGGTALTVTSTTVTLPANTSIGPVSATELGYLNGVTSALQTQLDLKAPLNSPNLTGNPTAPTPALGDSDNSLATTAFAMTMQSPNFSGTPLVPTALTGTANGQAASTLFVANTVMAVSFPLQAGNAGKFAQTDGVNVKWNYVPAIDSYQSLGGF